MEWHIIVNPTAGKGRGTKRWKWFEKKLKKHVELKVHFSEYRGHIIVLAKELIEQGGRRLAVVGGDGSLNELVNGVMQTKHAQACILAALPVGTGRDWHRSHGMIRKRKALKHMLAQKSTFHDVGLVQGRNESRYFINMLGAGFDAQVVIEHERLTRRSLIGNSYVDASVRALRTYEDLDFHVLAESEDIVNGPVFNFNVGICKYCGGGMMAVPQAKFNDGNLHYVLTQNISRWEVIKLIPKIFSGKYIHHPAVLFGFAKTLTISGKKPFQIDIDGDLLPPEITFKISIHPQAVRLISTSKFI